MLNFYASGFLDEVLKNFQIHRKKHEEKFDYFSIVQFLRG